MARFRWTTTTGVTFALVGATVVALADPDGTIPGTYELTGNEGTNRTKVKLVVGADGSVKRSVTYETSGATKEYSGSGTVSGQTLSVSFPVSGGGGGTPTPDPKNLAGAWSVAGRNNVGPYTATTELKKIAGDKWDASFRYRYSNGSTGSAKITGVLQGNTFVGERLRTTGLIGGLDPWGTRKPVPIRWTLSADGKRLSGTYTGYTETFTRTTVPSTGGGTTQQITGSYSFDGQGGATGSLNNPGAVGGWTTATEQGSKKTEPQPGDVRIVSPEGGKSVLAGQTLDVVCAPADATFEVSNGPGRKAANGKLQITGKGEVTIVAKKGDKTSQPVKLTAIGFEVVKIDVVGGLQIKDVTGSHMTRALGSTEKAKVEPACLLLTQPLRIKATLQSTADLAAPVRVNLVAESGATKLSGEAELSSLRNGQTVELASAGALNAKIDVNALELSWKIETEAGVNDTGAPTTPVRVYTVFKESIRNGPYYGEASRDIPTKDHLEKACTWAKGTSKNIGNGSDSICWALDNYVRHHVHPKNFKPNRLPFTSAYPLTSTTTPKNYADIDGHFQVESTGERPVGQLYYPPLDVSDPPKEDYSHYASNFGWWVLDNPTHTGGRCNQQAALMCDLFGTMGIKAQVHYLHRQGAGKRTGRPVRQYFNSSKGGQYWNFHGLGRAQLEDGRWWLYDGSFSFAPNRKNGDQVWAEAPGRWLNQTTPFIYEFGPWYYEDFGGRVPGNDIPDKHVAGDDANQGEYFGVPKAATEDLDWYNKSNP